ERPRPEIAPRKRRKRNSQAFKSMKNQSSQARTRGNFLRRLVRNFYFWFCRDERERAALHLLEISTGFLHLAKDFDLTHPYKAGVFAGKSEAYREWSDTILNNIPNKQIAK